MSFPTNFSRPDKRRPDPLWHQAEQTVRELIAKGTWPDGTQLPSEDKLSEILGVSRITVRHALRNLEESGLLRREHGRGTFVRSARVIAGVRGLTSFTQEMADRGFVVGSRVLEMVEMAADSEIASPLEIPIGTPVYKIRRLRAGNGQPIGIQTVYLPVSRFPGLLDMEEPMNSLYDVLRNRFDVTPRTAREIYRVGTVTHEDAELLEVEQLSPAFIVHRITSDGKSPFEFAVSIMRGDRYEIRSKLHL